MPGCTTGYKSNKNKLALFGVPKDQTLLAQWQRAVPRADKKLEENCAVCELHFDDRFISRYFEHTVNGELIRIDRTRPVLLPGAVPTRFPNLPAYCSKRLPPERKRPTRTEQHAPPRKKRAQETTTSVSAENAIDSVDINSDSCMPFENFALPSPSWGKHTFSVSPLIVGYSVCEPGKDKSILFARKLVVFTQEENGVKQEVFVKGIQILHDVCDDPASLLGQVDALSVCSGAGTVEEFPFAIGNKRYLVTGTEISSSKCHGTAQEKKQCVSCKLLRKGLLNQRSSRKQRSRTQAVRLSLRRRTQTQALKRLRAKLSRYEDNMKKLKQQSEELEENVLENRLKDLRPKQRLAIMQCFQGARRKSAKGMKYNPEWLLECMIMRIKSPRLYEHVRREGILLLPSRSCLKVYMRKYKSGFGFNSMVLAGIAEKTKSMDEFKRHGGLIIDEMKLSECLSVGTAGKVEGFVDLGAFTPDSEKHIPCDHGMVILFQPLTGSWHQILGVFASRGNVKAALLSRIVVEAVLLTEKAGLKVDFITSDGASWNRSMWRRFGISGSSTSIKSSVPHPVEEGRRLFFISDFPHLMKCVRNGFIKAPYKTPDGAVYMEHIKGAYDEDKCAVTLKVMPKITASHVNPNNFEKMKVNDMVQL